MFRKILLLILFYIFIKIDVAVADRQETQLTILTICERGGCTTYLRQHTYLGIIGLRWSLTIGCTNPDDGGHWEGEGTWGGV